MHFQSCQSIALFYTEWQKRKKKEKVKNFQNLLNVQECFDKFSTPLNAVQQQH